MKTKKRVKGSSARNLRLRLGVHSSFSFWNETLLTLSGAQAIFWGESTGPEMYSSDTGPTTFFWDTIFAWGTHFSLRGHKQWFGVHGPEIPPRRRACVVNCRQYRYLTCYFAQALRQTLLLSIKSNDLNFILWLHLIKAKHLSTDCGYPP